MMEPINDDNNAMPQTSHGSSSSSSSLNSSGNSKSSMYRAMVARRDSTAWRGAARSKLAAGIEEGTTEQANILATVDLDSNEQNNHHHQESSSTENLGKETTSMDGPDTMIQQYMDDADDDQSPSPPLSEEESPTSNDNDDGSAPSPSTNNDHQTQPEANDDQANDRGDATNKKQDQTVESSSTKHEATKDEVSQKGTDEDDDEKEKEPEIPVIYKNWEPKPEDEGTDMEDVELGGDSELADHIGEVDLDKGAFERLRALEQKEKERQRKERMYTGVIAVVILCLLALFSYMIVELITKNSNNNDNNNDNSQQSTMPPTPAPSLTPIPTDDAAGNANSATRSQQNAVYYNSMIPSYTGNEQTSYNLRNPQNVDQASISSEFTGHLTPLQQPEMSSNGNIDRITVKFPVNMLVPEGSSVLHKVYDGPDCSGGANDITGMDHYAKVGLYSAGSAQRTQNPADRMGLYLQWEQEQVEHSPLYQTRSAVARDSTPHFNPSATMDLCVGLMILNPHGLPEHYMETYILTSWNDDDLLQEVHTVPITIDST